MYNVFQAAIDKWGDSVQVAKAIEECSELSTVLARWLCNPERVKTREIREELADVRIMLEQMQIVFGRADGLVRDKMDMLQERIDGKERRK